MRKIEINVEEVPQDKLFLRQHYGEGKLGKIKFSVSLILPALNMMVEVDGKRYKVDNKNIITAILESHKSSIKKVKAKK